MLEVEILKKEDNHYEWLYSWDCPMCVYAVYDNLDGVHVQTQAESHLGSFHRVAPKHRTSVVKVVRLEQASTRPTWNQVAAIYPELIQAYVAENGPLPEGEVQEEDWTKLQLWSHEKNMRADQTAEIAAQAARGMPS